MTDPYIANRDRVVALLKDVTQLADSRDLRYEARAILNEIEPPAEGAKGLYVCIDLNGVTICKPAADWHALAGYFHISAASKEGRDHDS